MNPVLEQLKFMNKIVGLGRLMKMRRKHSLGLKYIRGYATTTCLWSLMNTGLLDEIREKDSVDIEEFAGRNHLDKEVLDSVCEYLDGIKVLNYTGGRCSLEKKGMTLLEEPRGLFELLYGYEPVFHELENMMRQRTTYGQDITRHGKAVARGSGRLGRQLPFLAVREIIFSLGHRRILDLGCGDLEFLFLLCEQSDLTCFGIDNDREALEYAEKRLKESNHDAHITVSYGDMFEVEALAEKYPNIDAITAIDVLHEYLHDGPETVINLLKKFKTHFPNTHLITAEFFKLPRVWLRRIPTSTLEHHLFHSLTRQTILPIGNWIKVFEKAGYKIVEKKLLHSIGHGYFVLE